MLHGSFILADDNDAIIKVVIFGVIGVFWLVGQVVKSANKSSKKLTPPRPIAPPPPPPMGTFQLPTSPKPPSPFTIGRPGGPATTLQDARRLAQARAAQAKAAQVRAVQARNAQAARIAAMASAPPVPPRPAPQQLSKPLGQSAPASAVTAPAVRQTAPPPPTRAAAAIMTAGHGPALRLNLTPNSLRTQIIISEVLGPPVALRQ